MGIIGLGFEGFRPSISDLSTREMMFEAAHKAYADAGIDPRKDADSFVSCDEDFWEGWSITDEMVPDQIGAARRTLCTVAADGITGIGQAFMHILSGMAEIAVVEAHSKVADVVDKEVVEKMALDPSYLRPLGLDSDSLAALEMSAFMNKTGIRREELDSYIFTAKARGLKNARASYGAKVSKRDLKDARIISTPMLSFDKANYSEASIVLVLASDRWIKKNHVDAVYIDAISWSSSIPWYEGGSVVSPEYAANSFAKVKTETGKSLGNFDILEIDDTYSYKFFQHLYAISGDKKEVISMAGEDFVNPSGGAIAVGHLIEASGLHRVLECILQLRGDAGPLQLKRVSRALAISWRGIPTATGAAIALSR
ncbi:MAG: hypothetical protein QXG05_06520 [Nitrososphaerota archaeon]